MLLQTLAVLSAIAIAQHAYYWTALPEQVATHFGPNGHPDSWMNRTAATCMMLGLQVLMPWSLVAITYLLRFLPASLINVPNREYWLHPDRKLASLIKINRFLTAMACSMSMFIMAINHLTFKANLVAAPLNMTAFLLVLTLFLISTGILTLGLWRRFQIAR